MAYNFMTLEKAKKEILKLQHYIDLVEGYQPISLEQEIVKEYALTSSLKEVSKRLNVNYEKVAEVISSLGKDELHKIVHTAYMKKTKHTRSWY